MYPPPAKIFHGPGPRKRSRGVAAKASERRPMGTPACAVIKLAKNALCASRRSTLRSFCRRLLIRILLRVFLIALHGDHRARRPHDAIAALQPLPDFRK